jgi:hypothetical protein
MKTHVNFITKHSKKHEIISKNWANSW